MSFEVEMKGMAGRVTRIILILMVTVGILYVGSRFAELEPSLHADVYETLDRPDRSIPDFQKGGNYSDIGHTLVNGVPFSYAVEVVHASVPDIIAYYKKLYSPSAIRIFSDEQMRKAGVQPGDMAFKMIRNVESVLGHTLSPVFTQVGQTYGFLGVLDRGDNEKLFVRDTGTFWDEVVGKAVLAFKEQPDSSETTVIRFWTEDKLDLRKLVPREGEDAPGFDVEYVDRYPYSRRIMSIGQMDRFGVNTFTVYEIADTPANVLMYYGSDLVANGWKLSEAVRKAVMRTGQNNYLFATREDRELSVFVKADGTGDRSLVIFQQKKTE